MSLCSCGKSGTDVTGRPEVQFATELWTKSLINSASESAFRTSGIGLFASDEGGKDVVDQNSHLSYDSTKWTYVTGAVKPIYWSDSDSYNFAAVWPYSKTSKISSNAASYNPSTGVLSIDCSDGIDMTAPDLMYENIAVVSSDFAVTDSKGYPVSYNQVGLEMKHAFAALDFKVINASGNAISGVGNPSLTGIEYKGTATILPSSAISWSLSGVKNTAGYSNTGSFDMEFNDTPQDMYGDWLLVLPQEVGGTDIRFGFWDGTRNVSCDLKDATNIVRWEPGRKYTYTMIISSKNISFTVSVVDWISHEYEL